MASQTVSEETGAAAARISVETLREYRRLGLVRAVEDNGVVRYQRDDLTLLFNAQFARPESEPEPDIKVEV